MSRSWLRIEALGRALFDGVDLGEGVRRRVDLGVLLHCEDERPLRGLAALVDWRCSGALSGLLRSGFCTGEPGESVLLPGRPDLPAERWLLFGMGRQDALDPARASALAERAVACALRLRPRDLLLALPGGNEERELAEAMLAAIVAAHEAAQRRHAAAMLDDHAPAADRGGHDRDGHDHDGHDRDGPDRDGLDQDGLDRDVAASHGRDDDRDDPGAPLHRDARPRVVAVPRDDGPDDRAPSEPAAASAPDDPEPAPAGVDDGTPDRPVAEIGPPHAAASEPAARSHAPAGPRPCPLWLVADGRHAGRLRRFIEGPPRAAEE